MNLRQSLAYTSPCFDAEATAQKRFGHRARAGSWTVSVLLTANVGLE
jgi:acyl dehydratase